MNYYNDNDRQVCAWLRELISRKLLPPGDVDDRSICDVEPSDLKQYSQCHFFAGIGGWAYALKLARWPASCRVWTGSCPCQSFSSIGKRHGFKDARRHLWPYFWRLIRQCRPPVVYGEQVADAIGFGWLDGICADMEASQYACGAAVLGGYSVNSPHMRRRLYWFAADTSSSNADGDRLRREGQHLAGQAGASQACRTQAIHSAETPDSGRVGVHDLPRSGVVADETPIRQAWACYDLAPFADGSWRRIEPGLEPLAHGIPARLVRMRGYGNAIIPQLAAEFIIASRGAIEDMMARKPVLPPPHAAHKGDLHRPCRRSGGVVRT